MLIDTHRAIKDLTQAGVPEHQAEAFVQVVTRADEQVATKEDIKGLEKNIQALKEATKKDIGNLEGSMDGKLAALEERLTRRMYAMGFLIIAALGALNFFT